MDVSVSAKRVAAIGGLALVLSGLGSCAAHEETVASATGPSINLESLCQPQAVQAAASRVTGTTVTIKQAATQGAPVLPNGVKFVPATDKLPAYCQISGTFVTNAAAGKTAHFLANLPANWNGKFLQLGCSGLCGNFFVSNAATPSITVTNQGYPGQILIKGYASFATDEGHESQNTREWAVRKDGSIDEEELADLYYRADKILAQVGKQLTVAFYAPAKGMPKVIKRSYFSGCSGGGRDAYVAAAHFPEEYDGIIGASPYTYIGNSLVGAAIGAASSRSPDARLTPAHITLFNAAVKAQCDGLDGVKDGIIQNPNACNFRLDRDLPRCPEGQPGAQCFTKAQVETLSVVTGGVTDENGAVLATGYSVSELGNKGGGGGGGPLGDVISLFTYKNDPSIKIANLFTFREGGPGQIKGFHAVVQASVFAKMKKEVRMGSGEFPEDAAKLLRLNRKLLLWSNLSDNTLLPFTAINYYNGLTKLYGAAKVDRNVRLFLLPGTDHCSITSIAPNVFDPLTAIENWVEKGQAPVTLMASVGNRQFSPGQGGGEASKFPNWTMPLCKFPIMARYSGNGDVKDGANWSCPANDRRMAVVGESGLQAGIQR